jgi:hypothetical protein
MPVRANVTSIEAIDSFRANLIVYISKARPALEEVSSDLFRMRNWIEHDQRIYWEGQVRRRARQLEDAKQALFSAEMANLRDATHAERMAVVKAKRILDEAEEKLKVVKKWAREFGNQVEPLAKRLEKLHTILSNDLPLGAAFLAQVTKALHDYAEIVLPPDGAVPSTPVQAAPDLFAPEKESSSVPLAETKPAKPEQQPNS